MNGNIPAIITATEIEKEKSRLALSAHQKLMRGMPLKPEESMAMNELIKNYKDIDKANVLSDGFSEFIPNQFSKLSFFSPAKTAPGPTLDMEKAMLFSLMKDTPDGNYANAAAKMNAENYINRSNYSAAFNNLQNKAAQSFQNMVEANPELSNPDMIGAAKNNFDILVQFAPGLALNPHVAGSFVKKTLSYGGIDESQISNLIQTNNEHMKHHSMLGGE